MLLVEKLCILCDNIKDSVKVLQIFSNYREVSDMPYRKELDFLRKMFAKCHLQLFLVDLHTPLGQQTDNRVRQVLHLDESFGDSVESLIRSCKSNTVYRLLDPFDCRYMFFLLPDTEPATLVVAGPYFSMELSYEEMLEQAERHGVNPRWFDLLEKYFASVPVLSDDSPLFAALDTFAELIWGDSNYVIVDLGTGQQELLSALDAAPPDSTETMWMMDELERRYAKENELLQAVSQGQFHKAERLMASFTPLAFERRLADPVRNLKNYCIVTNTLLRKAAEQGGVHPLHLDRLSSEYARRIENLSSVEMVRSMMEDIFRGYCRLVSKNATGHYSPPVQKAIMYIDANLSGELNLKVLSGMQNINSSYFSSLFKKETGQTLTEYINRKRMRQAMQLLTITKLQIQTIAQHCGISDVNYFSKLFKKHTGLSPNQYRQENLSRKP